MTSAPATNELLACPFCGGVASMEQTESNRWSVGCDAADEPACMGYQSFTTFARRSEATKAWNTRAAATPSAQGAEVSVDKLARDIWLAGFLRAFDRMPTDPWENQGEAVRKPHIDTATALLGKYRMEKRT